MSANAPDSTTIFKLQRDCADDRAIRTMLQTQEGKRLRVSLEHVLIQAAGESKIVEEVKDTYITVSWPNVQWLIVRICNLAAIKHLSANWLLRPAFMSQVMHDLVKDGGLKLASRAVSMGELASALVKASKAVPMIKVKPENVVIMAPPATGTWVDQAITCLLYTSPSPRDRQKSRMPSSA